MTTSQVRETYPEFVAEASVEQVYWYLGTTLQKCSPTVAAASGSRRRSSLSECHASEAAICSSCQTVSSVCLHVLSLSPDQRTAMHFVAPTPENRTKQLYVS